MQMEPADVIVVEGIMVLALEGVRKQLNMKIYVVRAWGADGTFIRRCEFRIRQHALHAAVGWPQWLCALAALLDAAIVL